MAITKEYLHKILKDFRVRGENGKSANTIQVVFFFLLHQAT